METFQNPREPRLWLRAIVGLFCALWLWAFMDPMTGLGLLVNPQTLIPLFVIMALSEWIRFRTARAGMAILSAFIYIFAYFTHGTMTPSQRMADLQNAIIQGVKHMLEVHYLIDPLQTLLFIWLLFGLFWLVVYAAGRPGLWVFYNILAVLVLALVDSNTRVHPVASMVTVLIICFSVLSFQKYIRLSSHAQGDRNTSIRAIRWNVPVLVFLSLCGALAVTLPTPKGALTWVQEKLMWGSSSPTDSKKMIGFQTNNTSLGGAFDMDYHPALSLVSDFPTYLRGLSSDIYTGKGWVVRPTGDEIPITPGQEIETPDSTFYGGIRARRTTEQVEVLSPELNVPLLFTGYAIDVLNADGGNRLNSNGNLTASINAAAYELQPNTGTVDGPRLAYHATYSFVSLDMEDPSRQLAALPPLPAAPAVLYPSDVQADLQLPGSLPKRVSDLAHRIVGNERSEYLIALKIQAYLRTHYPYATQNIPVPDANQDYVDQFLFESKRGYCNNFSSAMAVLLRTLQIPTRWVTGFAVGQQQATFQGGQEQYLIRNSDAHSWVEVYFPSIGWVPFDPTPNYQYPFAPAPLLTDKNALSSEVNVPPRTVQPMPKLQRGTMAGDPSTTSPKRRKPSTTAHPSAQAKSGRISRVVWPCLGLLMVMVLFISAWVFRGRIRLAWLLRRYSPQKPSEITKATALLFRLSAGFGGSQGTRMITLRDLEMYAETVGLSDEDYLYFVETVEDFLYGGKSPSEAEWRRVKMIFQDWITHSVHHMYRKTKPKNGTILDHVPPGTNSFN